jgi:hypothetical protein
MSAQYVSLDQCITAYLDESQQGDYKYYKLWNLAMRAMQELGLDYFYQIKSVKLPVMANKTVTLPNDYLQWSKIGVLNDQGEIIPLVYNEKFTTYAQQNNNRIGLTTDDTLYNLYFWSSFIFYNYWNGDTFMNLYGIPSGAPFVGEFKIDNNSGLILLNENFYYSYLMVEYLAAPNQNETYRIPVQFQEAMISYLRWKDIISQPATSHIGLADKAQRRHEYYNERRLGWARYRPFDMEQAYEWQMKNQRMAVKV